MLGLSGHYGKSRSKRPSGEALDVRSLAAAVDWSLPLGRYVVASGEAFAGDNLAGFQAGVFQGINADAIAGAGAPAEPRAVSARGGWAQVVAGPFGSRVALSAAHGLDDPDDADLESAPARPARLRNQVTALGLSYKASGQISFGIECRFLETRLAAGTRKDRHLNLAAVVAF